MGKYHLVYVRDQYDEEEEESLAYLETLNKQEQANARSAKNAPLEDIVDFLDQNLEAANYHEFVGMYDTLAYVLDQYNIDEETSRRILLKIAEGGGLEEYRPY